MKGPVHETTAAELVRERAVEDFPPLPNLPPARLPNADKKKHRKRKASRKPATKVRAKSSSKATLKSFNLQKPASTYFQVAKRQTAPTAETVLDFLKKYDLQNVADIFRQIVERLA